MAATAPRRVQGLGLAGVVDDLSYRYEGVFSRETVARHVRESYELLAAGATVTRFLPVLAWRSAGDRLRAGTRVQGPSTSHAPVVLFLCRQNAGRSQMAAALARHRSAGRVHARSAGSLPGGEVEPAVVEAMAELGIELADGPRRLSDDDVLASDVVVTMGCGDACPVRPGRRYLDWDLPDPAGRPLEAVRRIRDRIDTRVQALVTELLPDQRPHSTDTTGAGP